MATQLCPKCKSKRVRLGYRPTPTYLKIIFRYHLLCDECNWEFTGFAIPGTIPKKTRKKKTNSNNQNIEIDTFDKGQNLVDEVLSEKKNEFESNNSIEEKANNLIDDNQQVKLVDKSYEEELNKSDSKEFKKQKVKKKVRVKFY